MIWWNEKSYVRRVMVREMRVRVVMVVRVVREGMIVERVSGDVGEGVGSEKLMVLVMERMCEGLDSDEGDDGEVKEWMWMLVKRVEVWKS